MTTLNSHSGLFRDSRISKDITTGSLTAVRFPVPELGLASELAVRCPAFWKTIADGAPLSVWSQTTGRLWSVRVDGLRQAGHGIGKSCGATELFNKAPSPHNGTDPQQSVYLELTVG